MVPVYRAGQPTDSVEARRRDIMGIVVGVFQTNAVIGVILTQGYYLSRPVTAARAAELLREGRIEQGAVSATKVSSSAA